jgi:hypothetical protein
MIGAHPSVQLISSATLLLYTAVIVPVQICMWSYDDPCSAFPTLSFDVFVDTFFLVGFTAQYLHFFSVTKCSRLTIKFARSCRVTRHVTCLILIISLKLLSRSAVILPPAALNYGVSCAISHSQPSDDAHLSYLNIYEYCMPRSIRPVCDARQIVHTTFLGFFVSFGSAVYK